MIEGRAQQAQPPQGVLLLDKPPGPTSNRALQVVKRLYGARKAGHAGTLDPLASGLLPILFGQATRFASYLSDACKAYEATVLLGVRTATGDLEGEVLERRPVVVTLQACVAAAGRFLGTISQTPPMYSAIKHQGRPLYELARQGQTIIRRPREVRIHEFEVKALQGEELDVRVRCSKGTYIRVLAEDLGLALGCGATLKRLRRVAVGPLCVDEAHTLEALEAAGEDARRKLLLPVEAGLGGYSALRLDAAAVAHLRQGRNVRVPTGEESGVVRLYDASDGSFLGLGQRSQDAVHPLRLMADGCVGAARDAQAK